MTTEISAEVNRPFLPENGGGVSCEVTVRPQADDEPAERHIAIAVDTSGSMDNKGKIQQVQDAANLVFGLLNDRDHLSIVSFDTDARVIMEATEWGEVDRDEAERRVENMDAIGGTDIFAGLEEARDSLGGLDAGEDVAKRILLLSDGRDTGFETKDFENLAEDIADRGISIYSAGIGTDYDKEIIRTIGEHSQGRWAHVESPADIRSFFGDVVQEASTVLANNPRLVIDPVDGAEVAEVYRRRPQVHKVDVEYDEGKVVVGLPDLQVDEEQEVVLKMDAPGSELDTRRLLANIDLDAGELSASTQITVEYTDDQEKLSQQNEEVYIAHRDTEIRSEIARADSEDELSDVKDLIDETEVITGDTQVVDTLRDDVTRIEEGDEEEIRQTQEKTTVVFEDGQ